MDIVKSIEHEQLKNKIPDLKVGDTVKVHQKIKEGNRERIQVFEGIIIKKQNGGVNASFTVRKISYGVGVEKTFLVHSPLVEKVEVVRVGKARRAKLYYLRDRVGKAAKTKENAGARIENKEITVKEELVEEEKEIEEIHRLIYSTSDVNPTKSKFIADLDDIPQEYYVTVYYLINGFKTGTLSVGEYKALTNNNNVQKCRELKSDQVRIILKHVKDNIYVILGAATKKVDNDKKMYESMAKRSIPKIDTDNTLKLQLLFAEQVEKELTTIVESKGRKGNR